MGAIGEPKREIHIPVTRPGAPEPRRAPEPVPESPPPEPERAAIRPCPATSCRSPRGPEPSRRVALPWDVFATPIEAKKLTRLGVERDAVVLRPAFFRQLGPSYGVVAEATCPLASPRRPAGRLQLRLLRGRRREPALAARGRRARVGGRRGRARGPGHRARPRVPGERSAGAPRFGSTARACAAGAGPRCCTAAGSARWCRRASGARDAR